MIEDFGVISKQGYVAMTRSTEKLLITSHEENELFNELVSKNRTLEKVN